MQIRNISLPKVSRPDVVVIYCDERDVAQLGSAAALGAVGRRFKSCRPEIFKFGTLILKHQISLVYSARSNLAVGQQLDEQAIRGGTRDDDELF